MVFSNHIKKFVLTQNLKAIGTTKCPENKRLRKRTWKKLEMKN